MARKSPPPHLWHRRRPPERLRRLRRQACVARRRHQRRSPRHVSIQIAKGKKLCIARPLSGLCHRRWSLDTGDNRHGRVHSPHAAEALSRTSVRRRGSADENGSRSAAPLDSDRRCPDLCPAAKEKDRGSAPIPGAPWCKVASRRTYSYERQASHSIRSMLTFIPAMERTEGT